MEKIAARQSLDATGITYRPFHPGRLLAEEVEFRGLNANSLALKLKVPRNRLTAIMAAKRSITPDTALRLECVLGLSAKLFIDLQARYDLAVAERDCREQIMCELSAE